MEYWKMVLKVGFKEICLRKRDLPLYIEEIHVLILTQPLIAGAIMWKQFFNIE